jgi:hypothetical protein
MGDKRNQRVHDLDNATEACKIEEILAAESFLAFGPDTLPEARNRCYHRCPHCRPADEVA